MNIKTASTLLLISSIIWILTDFYWIADGLMSGWLNLFEDPITFVVRLMMLAPPIALICLSSALDTISKKQRRKICRRINDLKRKYTIEDTVRGDVIFCATGVTDGDLLQGIKSQDDYFLSETLVLHKSTNTNKILKNKNKK